MKYDFYADAGHGWLKVPISKLKELGIENKISLYSYIKNNNAYLEEDCDVSVFCDAIRESDPLWILNQHITEHQSQYSSIRGYDKYDYPKYEMLQKFIAKFDSDHTFREQVWHVVIEQSHSGYNVAKWDHSTYATISKRGRDWIMYLLENIDEKISQYEEKIHLVKEAIILSQSNA